MACVATCTHQSIRAPFHFFPKYVHKPHPILQQIWAFSVNNPVLWPPSILSSSLSPAPVQAPAHPWAWSIHTPSTLTARVGRSESGIVDEDQERGCTLYPRSFSLPWARTSCYSDEHLVTVTQFLSYLTAISHFERLNLAGQKTRKIPNPDCEGKHLSEAI